MAGGSAGDPARAPRTRGVRDGLAALGVPVYRRYLLATSANSVTVWLFQTAMSWLILSQTGSAAAVGFLFVAWTLPTLFTMIPAGVFVDRIGPRRGMPVLTRDLLHSGPGDLGLITASTGIGVIVGAFVMEGVGRAIGRGRTIILMVVMGAGAMTLLAVSRSLPVSMALAGVMACVLIVFRTTVIAVLQALAPARMRGRILSIFEIAFWGINPVGGVLGGILADSIGTMQMFLVFGGATVIAVVVATLGDRALARMDLDTRARVVIGDAVYSDGRRVRDPVVEGPHPAGGSTAAGGTEPGAVESGAIESGAIDAA